MIVKGKVLSYFPRFLGGSKLPISAVPIFSKHFSTTRSTLNSQDDAKSTLLNTPQANIRNIGIIAHIDAGKTTTTERMLYYSGLTGRIGNVDEGDTVTDYLTQEKDRGITIQSAAVTIPWNKHKINLIDTPGHADFTFEVIRSLRVLDGAVTILDAVAGVEAQTEKVWKQAKDLGIPVIAYINKMDREGAGFGRTVKEIVGRLATRVVLVNIPYFVQDPSTKQMIFQGVIDIFDKKLLVWKQNTNHNEKLTDGKQVDVIDISDESKTPELYQQCLEAREAAVEQLGEFDEKVIESFFETEDYMNVPSSILKTALRKATIEGYAIPVLCGASFKNIGVQPLLDTVNDYLPSPLDINPPEVISTGFSAQSGRSKKNNNKNSSSSSQNKNSPTASSIPVTVDPKVGCIVNNNKNLSTALAFKVLTHPNRGIMVFIRVYSGKIQQSSTIINTRTGQQLKIGKLLLMNGDVPLEVKELTAGNIGVITGTDQITTGDTLLAHSLRKDVNSLSQKDSVKLLPIQIPPPVFSVSLEPDTVADKRKLESSLDILIREDPSLKLGYDEDSAQIILSGMGELHLEIAKDRLVNDMKVKANIGEVKVTYKETIISPSKKVKNQSGENEKQLYSVQLSLDSFEGPAEETDFFNEEGSYLLENDNNMIIFEKNSTPENVASALKHPVWSLPLTFEAMVNSIIAGTSASLQVGGKIAKLPLHSTVVRIHKWEIPSEANTVAPLINCTRTAINEALGSLPDTSATILEPLMKVSVFVNDEDLGTVTQDLMGARNAKINGIDEDGSSTGEDLVWAREQAEATYIPHDPTLQYIKQTKSGGKKVITAEAPLKEMIGYLPKLRSLTKGRAIYDMVYAGMQRASPERLKQIMED